MCQISQSIHRKFRLSIGGILGSMQSINSKAEVKLRNSTTVGYNIEKFFTNPDQDLIEHSIFLKEQISEDFQMQIEFNRSVHDEIKCTSIKQIAALSDESIKSSTTVELEASMKNAIANCSLRLKNDIGNNLSTQIEFSGGTSGIVPMWTISSDIYYNLVQLSTLFKDDNTISNDLKSTKIKNINLIFGLSYGFDGYTINIGLSLAGVTVKLPILFSTEFPDVQNTQKQFSPLHEIAKYGSVITLFLCSTYLFHKLINRRKQRRNHRNRNPQ